MIKVLDKNTIDKIAAGEVIERPASVVKELTENCLDAGATSVTIEIKDGGTSYIRITDNGLGFAKDDIRVAFLRHATSKISSSEDLFSIKSLGFRGEALSSIASIARVELITKQKDEFIGYRYLIEGGDEVSFEESACPDGSTFVVRDIFFNTPVRKKFLKSNNVEAGYICEIVEKLALSHNDIAFKLINNGKVILHTSGKGRIKDDFLELYGLDIAKALIDVNVQSEEAGVKLSGVVAKPYISRGNRDLESFFVNGRFVKSKVLTSALEDGFKGFLMGKNYPVSCLYIDIDPGLVDVNVHPTKLEVRFSDNERIYHIIMNAVRDALSGRNMIVSGILEKEKDLNEIKKAKQVELNEKHIPEPFEIEKKVIEVSVSSPDTSFKNERLDEEIRQYGSSLNVIKKQEIPPIKSEVASSPINEKQKDPENIVISSEPDINPQPILTHFSEPDIELVKDTEQLELDLYKEPAKEFKLIGQVFLTYWLIEMDNTLFIVDQHAAHEKVLFERTMNKLHSKEQFLSQKLLPPAVITVSLREAEILSSKLSVFEKLGFEIEEFGDRDFKISGVPYELPDINVSEFFNEILNELLSGKNLQDPDVLLERVATMSCKAAVKGGNYLSFDAAKQLISDMLSLDDPYHCPHGRPTTISFTKEELEKKFKRII